LSDLQVLAARIIIIDYAHIIVLIKHGQESNFWESLLVSKVMKL
jgi:hypothetical protein